MKILNSSLHSIPVGWLWTNLGKVVHHKKGKKPPILFSRNGKNRLPYVDIKAFEKNEVRNYARMGSGVECSERDILLVWDGARSGLVGTMKKGIVGSTIMSISPIIIDSDYLFRFLQMNYMELNNNTRGTGIPHLDPSYVWDLPFPLAPLEEQRRISAKIESLLFEIKTIKESLENILDQIYNFRRSVLAKSLRGELTEKWREFHKNEIEPASLLLQRLKEERKGKAKGKFRGLWSIEAPKLPKIPEGWMWTNTRTLSWYVTSGSRDWKKYYNDSGPLFIRTQNINTNQLCLDDIAHVSLPEKVEGKRSLVERNDILITITGANVGKTAVITKNIGEAYISQSIALMKLVIPETAKFVQLGMITDGYGKTFLENMVYGIGRPVLSLKNVQNVILPLPPLLEQQEIVETVESYVKTIDDIEEVVIKNLKKIDILEQSVFVKAFSGKLIPQDPKDEPVFRLLERITIKRKEKIQKKKKSGSLLRDTKNKITNPFKNFEKYLELVGGEASVEQIFEASKLNLNDFWEKINYELEKGQLEKIQKGKSILLRLKR